MAQQSAVAAPAAGHDDKDVTPVDREVEIALNNEIAIGHRQIFHHDMRFPYDIAAWIVDDRGPTSGFHFGHIFRVVQITVAVASIMMISTMHKTTAVVAA